MDLFIKQEVTFETFERVCVELGLSVDGVLRQKQSVRDAQVHNKRQGLRVLRLVTTEPDTAEALIENWTPHQVLELCGVVVVEFFKLVHAAVQDAARRADAYASEYGVASLLGSSASMSIGRALAKQTPAEETHLRELPLSSMLYRFAMRGIDDVVSNPKKHLKHVPRSK